MKLYNHLKSEIIKNWQEMKKDRSLMLKNLSKALFLFSAIAFIFNFGYFIFFLFSGLAINERAKKFIIEKLNKKNFSNKKYIGIMLSIAFLGFIFSGDSDDVNKNVTKEKATASSSAKKQKAVLEKKPKTLSATKAPSTSNDKLCYKYNWEPSLMGNNKYKTDAEGADIMARVFSAAQCIGYVVGYGKRIKSVSPEDEVFYRETIARMAQNVDGSCPKRELFSKRDYKLEFEMGEATLDANLVQNVTGSMDESALNARIFACKDVLKHYLEVLKK